MPNSEYALNSDVRLITGFYDIHVKETIKFIVLRHLECYFPIL